MLITECHCVPCGYHKIQNSSRLFSVMKMEYVFVRLEVTILILFTGTSCFALYFGFAPVSIITAMLHNRLFIL